MTRRARAPARAAAIAAALGAAVVAGAPAARADDGAAVEAPRAAGHGVAVVALGVGAEDAARALARAVYRDAALRPPIDEGTAQVLVGAPAGDDAPAATRERAALRAALAPDPTDPATRRALESLATELGVAAVAVVFLGGDGAPRARVVRADSAELAPVELVATAPRGEPPTWPSASATLRLLVTAPTPATGASPAATTPTSDTSPARAAPARAAAPSPDAAATTAAPPAAEEPAAFYERPWFWVALGAFAAAGLTAVVVSQTASEDEPGDSVRFRATIPEALVTFP